LSTDVNKYVQSKFTIVNELYQVFFCSWSWHNISSYCQFDIMYPDYLQGTQMTQNLNAN